MVFSREILLFFVAILAGTLNAVAGVGILMLATLALMGMENIHVMNALKTLLATVINAVASFLPMR